MSERTTKVDGHKISRSILFLLAGLMLCSCTHTQVEKWLNDGSAAYKKLETRDNAASLLYDLLGDERNVSKILIIKRNSEELGRLISSISKTAADYHTQLDSLAANDPSLDLHAVELPPGERAARAAAAKTAEHELLVSSGKEFEFNLLLTQAQALSYGAHLAKVAAENSSLPEEVQKFTMMSQDMSNLCKQVTGRMRQE